VAAAAVRLCIPTAMTFGLDGDLYVSNLGLAPAPLAVGEVLRIHMH